MLAPICAAPLASLTWPKIWAARGFKEAAEAGEQNRLAVPSKPTKRPAAIREVPDTRVRWFIAQVPIADSLGRQPHWPASLAGNHAYLTVNGPILPQTGPMLPLTRPMSP